jgi:hypothetical protein
MYSKDWFLYDCASVKVKRRSGAYGKGIMIKYSSVADWHCACWHGR